MVIKVTVALAILPLLAMPLTIHAAEPLKPAHLLQPAQPVQLTQMTPTPKSLQPAPHLPSALKEEQTSISEMKIPTAERFILDNGIVVYFVHDAELPLLRVAMIISGGAKDDAMGKEGAAQLLSELMRAGGSAKYAAEQLDERLDSLATTITTATGEQTSTVALTSLQENTDESLAILSDILLKPALPSDKMEVLKGIALENIRRLQDDPQALVFQHFNRLMHADTPLYRYATERSIKAITRNDLLAMHKKLVTPNKVFIAASGALSAKATREKLNTLFGGWGKPDGQKAIEVSVPSPPHNQIYFIVKDSPQSIIIQGWLAPKRASAAAYPTEIINRIMGGEGLVSRLFSEVRTNKGYAYATGSFYRQNCDFGLLGAYSFVKAEATIPTLILMNAIAADIAQGNFTSTEIEMTKNSLRNRFVFLFDSPFAVAQKLLELEYFQLPRDFYERYLERVTAVSNGDMQKTARAIFKQEEMLTIIIAPIEQLEKVRVIRPEVRVIEAGKT